MKNRFHGAILNAPKANRFRVIIIQESLENSSLFPSRVSYRPIYGHCSWSTMRGFNKGFCSCSRRSKLDDAVRFLLAERYIAPPNPVRTLTAKRLLVLQRLWCKDRRGLHLEPETGPNVMIDWSPYYYRSSGRLCFTESSTDRDDQNPKGQRVDHISTGYIVHGQGTCDRNDYCVGCEINRSQWSERDLALIS